MKLEEAIKHILDGNAVLFAGAGFSSNAKNYLNEPLGQARELSHNLCDELGIPHDNNLEDVAEYYLNKDNKNKQKIIEKLQNYYICKEPANEHKVIAKYNWKRIYTTNYDNVIELAGKSIGKEWIPRTMYDKINDIINSESVIHLNGYIRNLSPEKLDNEFKLTNRSYLLNDFFSNDLSGLFENDIKNAKAIIFIGTSLKYDIDVQKIIYSPTIMKSKIIFIDKKVDKDKIDVISETKKKMFGEIFYIGLKEFAEKIEEIDKAYVPNTQNFKFRSFKYLNSIKYLYKDYKVQDSWDLFAYGSIDNSVIASTYDKNNYLFQRSCFNRIEEIINNDTPSISIIHSNLGNGKTCFINYLAEYLKSSKNVFMLDDLYDNISEEIEYIARMTGDKIIFIENYNYYLNILGKFKPYIDKTYKFILTCRTYINDNFFFQLSKKLSFNHEDIYEFDLNKLEDSEINKIIKIFHNMEIYPFNKLSYYNCKKIIQKDYNSCLSDLLLACLKSNKISNEIDKIYRNIEHNLNLKKVLLAIIINNVISLDLKLSEIIRLIDITSLSSYILRDENINEFININTDNVEFRSSNTAIYLINKHNLHDDLLEVMENMIINSDKLINKSSEKVKRYLISISNMTELFFKYATYESLELRTKIVIYFDKIKNNKYYKNNNFFWLQYAMACIDAKLFNRAGNYFNIAYDLAKHNNTFFNTYQIDTQYGRYLLESGINGIIIDSIYKDFEVAHYNFLNSYRSSSSQKYYVYKQINLYYKYINIYKNSLVNNEINKIITLLKNFVNEIYKNIKNSNRNYEMAIKSIEELNKCNSLLLEKNIKNHAALITD